jgi:hypothetical protein
VLTLETAAGTRIPVSLNAAVFREPGARSIDADDSLVLAARYVVA